MDTAADGREAARMSDRHRDHGRFVWFELLTTDPLGAVTFYGDVVGWHTQPFELPGATGPRSARVTAPIGAPLRKKRTVPAAS